MRQDLIALRTNYHGTTTRMAPGLVLDERGKNWRNLAIGRYVENQQPQPESTGPIGYVWSPPD